MPKKILSKTDNIEFERFIKESTSIAQVLKRCGLNATGANYITIKNRVAALKLDISHFTGAGHLKGKTHSWAKIRPLSEILVKDSTYTSSNHLRLRLIKEGVFEQKCYECGLTDWRGKPVSFALEHKNGTHSDNRLENLTILCPNCHSQTPTYSGKNKGKLCKTSTN